VRSVENRRSAFGTRRSAMKHPAWSACQRVITVDGCLPCVFPTNFDHPYWPNAGSRKPIALFSVQFCGAGESHGKLSRASCIFYELRLWMGTRKLKVEDLA
jgi:hypothetical protein